MSRASWAILRSLTVVALGAFGASCAKAPAEPALFESLTPDATGVKFTNTLPETPDFNILNYLYYFNGGGVAVGDVNGDGRQDLYFSSNVGPNRLYLNKGHFQFEDVTEKAGVGGPPGWKTGVTMADVNGDGKPDIYVSAVSYLSMHGRNMLYINNGDGTFTDRAAEYGVDHVGYSTQALFFDYDGDGDLDLFLLSHSTHTERAIGSAEKRDVRSPLGGGRLYRNDGGHFTDVSAQAGIYGGIEGFGLGVVASDFDGDGCPDLYVANDFQEQDFLYHNNCNGTFTEQIAQATKHTSRFAMGVDAADMNNDGRPDLFVADMMPDREDVLKTSASYEGWNLFNLRLRAGYHAQYARNTLQLNRGNGRFADIAFLSGVFATDWSWAPLFADFDNDGRKDLFVSSGIYRRPNDLDYINYVGNDAQQAALAGGVTKDNMKLLALMPQVPVSNHLYRNDGELQFTDKAAAWGVGERGFSNGAVYVDLDNTGSLDLVLNRVNAPASIYRNRSHEISTNRSLTIALKGAAPNTGGIGANVVLRHAGTTQMLEAMPTRGFESSVDPRLHFGVGATQAIDSVIVTWPDRRRQVLTHVPTNQVLTLVQTDAPLPASAPKAAPKDAVVTVAPFTDITSTLAMPYRHVENDFNDFDREPLMPHLLSALGPALAVGDVNGDGLDDVYAGGAKWQPGTLMLQQKDGRFVASPQPAIAADSISEDVDATFFDANGDGHPDLLVVSAGNEFWGDAEQLQPRLYLNDGQGHFTRAKDALGAIAENGGAVAVGDYDGDGHPDLFLGSRVVSRQYGMTPTSHLLRNDGTGRFTDVSKTVSPALAEAGMVSSAAWFDYDADGKLDLVVVGEWMPVRVFHSESGKLVERTGDLGLSHTEGWWNVVTVADVNGDRRPDLVLGNLGRNSYITASDAEPARLYIQDFQHNGTLEQVLTFYKHGVSYPMYGRDEILKLVPALRPKFQSFAKFGAATIDQIFPSSDLKTATVREARTFSSAVALNTGKTFSLLPLPVEAQIAPIYGIVATDLDGDGKIDLVIGGNDYGAPPLQGRYDASDGLALRGMGDGHFVAMEPLQSHLMIGGQVRHLATIRLAGGGRAIIAARNNESMQVVRMAR